MIQKIVPERRKTVVTTRPGPVVTENRPLTHAKTDIVPINDLSPDTLRRWELWHRHLDRFDSPYYHPEFTRAVSSVRNDVRVAVFRDSTNKAIGILPFQPNGARDAVPVGGRLNDFHGILTPNDVDFDIASFLRTANLRAFAFHAANWDQPVFRNSAVAALPSHEIDLTEGAKAWHKWACTRSSTIRRQGQKTRALIRHLGPVRFVLDSDREENLERLIQLKRQRYRATHTFDILGVPWCQDLLRRLFQCRVNGFRPVLSELWAGQSLIAVHFGMANERVFHYWFPVYAPEFARYSPGTLMLLETIQNVGNEVRRIDLSYGDDPYKFKFTNARSTVAFGVLSNQRWLRPTLKARYLIRRQTKSLLRIRWAKRALRAMLPRYGAWNYR